MGMSPQEYTEEGWCMSDEFDLEEYLDKAEYFETGLAYVQDEFEVSAYSFKEFM
jgi:hypothetical protein